MYGGLSQVISCRMKDTHVMEECLPLLLDLFSTCVYVCACMYVSMFA